MLRIILLFALSSSAISAEESYPAGTLTETVDLDLQPVDVEVPETFRDRVPEGLTLNLPKGFSVSIFAVNFRRPRFMAFDANDVLHVADMGARTIVALPDRDGDGVADEHVVAASGFREAHSLAFHDGAMYVADTDAIIRLDDGDGNLVYEERELVTDLTSPGPCCSNGWHTTRTLVIDDDAGNMYVGIGSPCDLCRSNAPTQADRTDPLPPSPEWGAILEFNLDGSGRRIFATGMRNVIGMTRHPVSGELWANNNGHNLQGRSSPPEWIDIVRDGDFLGHPLVNSHQVWNDFSIPLYEPILPITREDSLLVATHKKPVALVPAHYAPMGLHFYTHNQFPSLYRGAAFVAFRAGKAYLSSHPGYNVSVLFADPDGANARIGEFITGFQTGTTRESVWGHPVGLVSDRDGSLFITSDTRTPVVLKVTHSGITGDWQHDLPDVLPVGNASFQLSGRVDVELLEEGGPVRVTADLTAVGGPDALPLTETAELTYRLDAPIDLSGLPTGRYTVLVRLEQEIDGVLRFAELPHVFTIVPDGDVSIVDDLVASDWQIAGKAGARAVGPSSEGPVYHGTASLAVEVEPEKFWVNWSLELTPPSRIDPYGFAGLRLAFHPGTVGESQIKTLTLFVNDSSADLVLRIEEDLIDLGLPEWQVVEVPFDDFRPAVTEPVASVRLEGRLTGTLYLDDVRFVTAIPALPPSVPTAVLEEKTQATPGQFELEQNYPNPFNSGTSIGYSLAQPATVSLVVYSMTGQKVATLVYGWREAGLYEVRWDGLDNADRELASGVYVYRLTAGNETLARKLLLLH